MTYNLESLIGLATVSFGVIAWAIRLEAKQKQLERDQIRDREVIMELKAEAESMRSEVLKRLGHIEQTLAEIQGYLKAKKE